MADWFKKVRKDTDGILEAIKAQPFIKELMDGTLPKDIFEFYINQDALYLAEYKRVLATVGIKCTDPKDMQFFLDAATGIITVEDDLHDTFLKGKPFNPEPSPSCELYTSYLARVTNNCSVAEGLAAVLPCFTIYKEIGDYILANQTNKGSNQYQDWIDTYGGTEFEDSVNQAVAITNKYAALASADELAKMGLAFEKSSKLEYLFWDSAYKKEEWTI